MSKLLKTGLEKSQLRKLIYEEIYLEFSYSLYNLNYKISKLNIYYNVIYTIKTQILMYIYI